MTGIIPRISGFVKMYHPRNGYGFVQACTDDIHAHRIDSDIMVFREAIAAFGQPLVCDATVVVGDVLNVPGKGWRATRIISQKLPDIYHTDAWFPATGRIYFPAQGFGFLTLDATGQEVMVHSDQFATSAGPVPSAFKGGRYYVKLVVKGAGLKVRRIQPRV